MAHAAELAGRRVRLVVLPPQPEAGEARIGREADSAGGRAPGPQPPPLSPANRRMLELLAEWERTPLTDEERAVLDGLEQHLREEPFSLRSLEDAP